MWTIVNLILDIIFPKYCIGCKKANENLCENCLSKIPPSRESEHEFIISIFDYKNPIIKKAIWLLKYKNKTDIAKILSKLASEILIEELSEIKTLKNFQNPLIIPIPLSRKRQRERKYNQAEIIAKEIIKNINDKTLELSLNTLYKNKETGQQARILNRRDRLKNLSDCFVIKNIEKIKGRNIILVDDVTTTGATLVEARKTLKKAGARQIIAITLAH